MGFPARIVSRRNEGKDWCDKNGPDERRFAGTPVNVGASSRWRISLVREQKKFAGWSWTPARRRRGTRLSSEALLHHPGKGEGGLPPWQRFTGRDSRPVGGLHDPAVTAIQAERKKSFFGFAPMVFPGLHAIIKNRGIPLTTVRQAQPVERESVTTDSQFAANPLQLAHYQRIVTNSVQSKGYPR